MAEDVVQKSPSISVIIPVFNCAPFLRRCLDSVVAQSDSSWEIISVDDGSTDGSIAILHEYEEKLGGKMRVIEQENAGPAKARNRAIDIAAGQYLAFLDADDFLDSRCFELAFKQAQRFDAQIVVWDIWFYNDRHERLQHPPLGILNFAPFDSDGTAFSWRKNPDEFLLSFQTWPWNKLYLTSYVRDGGYRFQEDVMRSEDIGFVYPALVDADRIVTVGERLISYRVMRDGSAMATKDRHAFDFVYAIKSFRQHLVEAGCLDMLLRSYVTWAMSSVLYNLQTLASFEAFSEVYEYLQREGLSELGLLECTREVFLDPVFYDRMLEIANCDSSLFLFNRSRSPDIAREDALAVLDFVSAERDEAQRSERAARDRETIAVASAESAHAELQKVSMELDEVLGASEQRIGSAICRIPRAIQRRVLDRRD